MTNEIDPIQNAIRHIQTSVDIDPWAMEIAVKAMTKQMEDLKNSPTQMSGTSDLISRQAAIDLFPNDDLEWDTKGGYIAPHLARRMIEELPSAEPEQCEYAVNALAVEEMLKDLLPESGMWEIKGDEAKTAICEVVRSALEGLWKLPFVKPDSKESSLTQKALDNNMPSAQPKQQWIPCSERLPQIGTQVLCCNRKGSVFTSAITYISNGIARFGQHYEVTAWMPLPEPYRESKK